VPASRGDELIDRLRAGAGDSSANDLLSEVFRGYPVENLSRLLRSSQETAVKAGAWIVSELGVGAAPLLDEVVRLLGHPLRYVRFFAVDAVQAAATPADGAAVAAAIALVADRDDAVEWKALTFLAWADRAQLEAGIPHLADPRLGELTSGLLTGGPQALAALDDPDHLTRAFAAAAAVRTARQTGDRTALEHAAASGDPAVASFATGQLESGRLPSGH
jgi:hypothetical protein